MPLRSGGNLTVCGDTDLDWRSTGSAKEWDAGALLYIVLGLGLVAGGLGMWVSADDGTLEALVDAAEWDAREQATPPPQEMGVGRELFAMLRHHSDPAEKGGSAMLAEAGL